MGHWCKDHNHQAALRHCAKQTVYDLCVGNPISRLLTMALSTLCKFQSLRRFVSNSITHYTSSKGNWMPPHTGWLQLEHTRDDAHSAHNMTLRTQATGTHTRLPTLLQLLPLPSPTWLCYTNIWACSQFVTTVACSKQHVLLNVLQKI